MTTGTMTTGTMTTHVMTASVPLNKRRRPNAGLMLGHRLRRWPNNKPTLGECV